MTGHVVERRAARVLVVDPDGAVLMIHGFDPHEPGLTYWYTIGGGVDDGESDLDPARRASAGEKVFPLGLADLLRQVHPTVASRLNPRA
jgi:8-oxo-dGTP pyrophosphatase MutT (NUDIX family)